jgi:type IV pilus assembly protein PilC
MAKFRYSAFDHNGKINKGMVEANSSQLALEELKTRELWVTKLYNPSQSLLYRELSFGGPRVKTEHFTVFCRQLSTMYKSGIGMMDAVRILGGQTESKPFKKVLIEVSEEMKRGTQFSDAAAAFPTVFTTVFINMIRAGEASGNLDEMLERLAVFYEKEHNTREKVKSAMIYPAIMGVVTVLVVTFMMIFVIPRYVANFESMGIELPLPTRIIMGISDFMQGYWYIVILLFFVPNLSIYLIKKMPMGQYYIDYAKLKIPVFGKLWHKQSIARFSRTFSSLFAAAIPMLQTMTIVSKVVGNEVIGKVIIQSREGLREGQAMAEPFANSWLFPPMVVQMMAVGEKTGALDTMMEKVADFYEADVDTMADRLKSLLEPIMILLLSGIVGGIVLAILMPTFKMMENL